MQCLGAFGDQVEYFPVTALGLRRFGLVGGEFAVDVGEELGQLAGSWTGGQDPLLVVAELGPDQIQVALGFCLLTSANNSACAPPGRDAYPSVVAVAMCLRCSFAASKPPGRSTPTARDCGPSGDAAADTGRPRW